MHAVGRDDNNQMYPIAMAVVESELKDSWTWFLELLTYVIGKPEDKGWIFISDGQKGLTESMNLLFPGVVHRYCMRHMYSNFQKVHKGKELEDLMWGAASAYTVPEFRAKMMEARVVVVKAHEWLLKEPPKYWERCFYSPRAKTNRMVNNLSESFNNAIKKVRDQPILTMMKGLRRYVMQRYVERTKCALVICRTQRVENKSCGFKLTGARRNNPVKVCQNSELRVVEELNGYSIGSSHPTNPDWDFFDCSLE
ncbi:uncharacterized protein LOC131317406 [Rhododendron vialii]|uniref:uncharacterized protein LOC131317406 n=1 Tax=Rhododendron vialii TaxID=182163 RepID=UPI00265F6EBD|nr:uncharacterized protein LOC131317406 [Rhododendron vialii]